MIAALLWALLLLPAAVHALTITSAATGNWNAVATWAIVTAGIPGRITTSTASTAVTGNASTLFLQLKPGDQLYTTGNVLIGTINSVASDSSLTLSANATVNLANALYRVRKVPDANDAANVGTTATHAVTIPAAYAAQVGALAIGATTTNDAAVSLAAANSSLNAGAVTINRTSSTPRTHSLNVNAGTATLASLAITGGTGSRAGQLAISTGTATVTGAITFAGTAGNARITFTNNGRLRVSGSLGTGGTLTPSTGTVEYDGAGAQTVQSGYSYYNLTLSTGGTKTPSAGTVTVGGTLTLNSGVTYDGTTNNPAVSLTGNFSNSGTFNSGTGLFTFAGTNHALTGTNTNTTFTNLRINSTGTLTLSQDATVNGTLTFSNGRISTGASNVILGAAGIIATPSATSYVVGNFRKTYAALANLSYVADDFPVGDATNYTPVNITAGTTTTAGTLTVSTTATDHPQVTTPIPSTGIDATLSVNRYWRFVSNGVTTGTDIAATFNFIAGTPVDLDAGTQTSNFIVQRYDQTIWHQTTLNAASADNTQVGGIAIGTGTHDFAIGQPLPGGAPSPVGRFNVFQSATPANDLEGKIFTKQAGVSVTDLDVIHVNAAKNNLQGGSVTVDIQLLDASSGGATDADGCSATDGWPVVPTTLSTYTFTSRGTLTAFTVPNTYRNLRFRVRYPAGGPYTQIGCSQDNFAVRPTSITISAHDATWQTAGTGRLLDNVSPTGGNVHAASTSAATTPRPFTLRATAQAQSPALATFYDGSPTMVTGYPACGTLCVAPPGPGMLTFGSWSGTNGVRDAEAHYSEAGTVLVQLEDSTYAAVDDFDGSTADMRTVRATGNVSVQIGRFVSDRFEIASPTTPRFATFEKGSTCTSRSFTYIGQPFWYDPSSPGYTPGFTFNAVNAAGVVTSHYRENTTPSWNLFKATLTETYSNNGTGPALSSTGTSTFSKGNGTASYSADSGGTLLYNRPTSTPLTSPFTANISLALTITDDTEVGPGGNPTLGQLSVSQTFNGGGSGIAFDLGAEFRHGRLRLQDVYAPLNGNASGLVPVPIVAQYWTGTTFSTNTLDSCTSLIAKNFVLYSHQGSVTTGNMPTPTNSSDGNIDTASVTLASGTAIVNIKKTTSPIVQPGSVRICLDLDTGAGGDTSCQAVTPAGNPTPPGKTYLQGPWSGASHDKDPSGRASFGLFGSQPRNFIFQRENY